MKNVSVVILAAGQGTRMKSNLPKILHPLAGKPMVDYALEIAAGISETPPVLVVGHGADHVRERVGERAIFAVQEKQLGTAHAVRSAEKLLAEADGLVLIYYADMPLLRRETLGKLVKMQGQNSGPLTILTVQAEDPRGFGRVVRSPAGTLQAIVEEASASEEILRIRELNAGVYCCRADWLWTALKQIKVSPKGEYYLTDLVEIASGEGGKVDALVLEDESEAIGINNRVHLAEAAAVLRRRINEKWMLNGVSMVQPESVFIDETVTIGEDTTLLPNTYLRGNTAIGKGCEIGPDTIITDCTVSDNCRIQMAVMEGAELEEGVVMGPFARLRKGARLGKGVHMGNFGEVKNSTLGPDTRMGHFSYIGDATIGEGVNIGAGTVTCNFDGVNKNRTVIEDGVFIGSDTMLVAPVKIGKNSKTGAGAVVTRDVPANKLVVGVPAKELKDLKEK
jgi:bifunctional UDP-N-acetylglucosamine pyrophosphorylase/glucosamine-1-phosphate N-acetyltransferase